MCLLLIGCKTPKVLPPSNLLTANTFDKSLQILRQGLHSDEFWPSIHSAEALIDAGYGFEVNPVLREKLKAEEKDVYRASIAKALLRGGRRDAIVVLQDIILGNDEAAQLESLKGLFHEVAVADTSIVGNLLRTTTSEQIHVYALALLHVTEKEKTVDQIREKMTSSDPLARVAALDVLPFIGSSEQDTTQIKSVLSTAASTTEQLAAHRALAILDHAPSRGRLVRYTGNADPSIRSIALYAMAESWLIEDVEQIYPLLEDSSLSVRVRAAQALLTLNDSGSAYRFLRIR